MPGANGMQNFIHAQSQRFKADGYNGGDMDQTLALKVFHVSRQRRAVSNSEYRLPSCSIR
jgi:hypothetical protein